MQTTSLGIANYCVPCRCDCRYCLLDSCRKATGVDYRRGAQFAERIDRELKAARPDISCHYYIGYCMDTPELESYIRFCGQRGYPGGKFLQMNGLGFRDQTALKNLMDMIHRCGVQMIDLTIYGTREYHDAFAGRKGDFDCLLRMADAAGEAHIPIHFSLPLTRENKDQADELLSILSAVPLSELAFFLPHSKGRGRTLMNERLTKSDYEALSELVRARFRKTPLLTEAEWLAENDFPSYQERSLVLVLNPEEMDRLENMRGEEVLRFLEALDDQYLSVMPSPLELAQRYGDRHNDQMFRRRDLLLKWKQQYITETHSNIWDMDDETHHFVVHR